VTVQDLLNQIAGNAGDSGADFAADARRWLNLTRSYIAGEAVWKWAMRDPATITTAAATTSGLYNLTDSITAASYAFVAGDLLFDQTNENTISYESLGTLLQADHDKSTTGPPTRWADAGQDGSGNRQIYLWPVPDDAYTVVFPAYLLLTDLTSDNDGDDADAFFGPISPWGACFAAGMRYYNDLDNNESDTAIALSDSRFKRHVNRMKAQNRPSPTASLPARIVRTRGYYSEMGRLPSSYPRTYQ